MVVEPTCEGDCELPVPHAWRPTLKLIADALVAGRPPGGPGIQDIDDSSLKINHANISQYPDEITQLSLESWASSVHVKSGEGCWTVLLDLTTSDGSVSDLVLHVRVLENDGSFEFLPELAFVP